MRAWRVPGSGTRKTQIPRLAFTTRLSWTMVKPVPVPTRATTMLSGVQVPAARASPTFCDAWKTQ
jgi:hypothetical protein